MMWQFVVIFSLLGLSDLISAQFVQVGQCNPNIQLVNDFNLSKFTGKWYGIGRTDNALQNGDCSTLTLTATNQSIIIINEAVNKNIMEKGTGNATLKNGTAKFTINVSTSETTIDFWILSTDYSNFALAYACYNRGMAQRNVYIWQLGRSPIYKSPLIPLLIDQTLNNLLGMSLKDLKPISHSQKACSLHSDIPLGQPVIIPGQCDSNITVLQNFNITKFSGIWYTIASYYSENQMGACGRVQYTVSGNMIDVVKSEVINQTLRTISGTAMVSRNDSSARISVNLRGTTGTRPPVEFLILDTDYDSYALAYSCRNLNSSTRRIWSWKLSRTRELSETAINNISKIVNNTDVLNNRYYQFLNHSDTACAYYPPYDGNSVIFRGQCNTSVPVVDNFDIKRYVGKWYDIESYPQAFQNGTCPTATYNITASGMHIKNTEVLKKKVRTVHGIGISASFNSSAKLIVSFPIAGTNLTTSATYWVLATDYDSYSLVYSCTNEGKDWKRVTSWKLSRTRNLTSHAVTEINRVIKTVPVLHQEYYIARGHSDADCLLDSPINNGGPVILNGQCTKQDVVMNFNLTKFSGTWYEVSRYPSELQNGNCTTTSLKVNGTNSYTLTQTMVYNKTLVTLSGVVSASNGTGILNARLIGSGVTVQKTFYILSTNYRDHALIMSCSNIDSHRKQVYSWKLSRSRNGLSNDSNAVIKNVINNNVDLFEEFYQKTDQSNSSCLHNTEFPKPEPPSIILPGRCDETIKGKSNFNLTRYLGKWNEIARYPVSDQLGQCARAEYIAVGHSVMIRNSQVINKTLDIKIGSAVLASNDSRGVLNVSFGFNNTVHNISNYYILETDYTSFALVYSCRNLENNKRQVSSWKLSRSRTLSNQANAIMNNIIVNTSGLFREYYTATRQDQDACFYVPELNRNKAPIFRGQCQNITGVPNFDAKRYVGWWHEIERYPSDVDVGNCISSNIRVTGNQSEIVDINVFNFTAQVVISTVKSSNNGRLTKTFSNGKSADIWVLATDYETYSLLYSCENVNNEYMRVWSAKHSKTRKLTEAAQKAMDSAIQGNKVLIPKFFLSVNQSDSACFHYPEQTGTQIILPGQCDAKIPVVQRFNPTHYSGTWYQIERYPQKHETGSCSGTRYTLNNSTSVISTLHWQLINGTLDLVEGSANINSNDGSARLRVRLPVRDDLVGGGNGTNPRIVERELWILTTDYISYSLAYSCVNINSFERAVGVWKLSRTRTMSKDGTIAIKNYMATRKELFQPYFLQVFQSNGCLEPSYDMKQ